ncbi:MAG: hypothetical protein Q8Q26_13830, partial [Pseudorhodobacter sp.]|nr:hypothetical protein [Pseudorhodobacter sp.]
SALPSSRPALPPSLAGHQIGHQMNTFLMTRPVGNCQLHNVICRYIPVICGGAPGNLVTFQWLEKRS